ncbi:MAG: thymidylate synthase ThyX [Kiritimatiellae bacterium]|nr:thymidylate synthase ThyX [Kiritimatiellia bacterium]
MALELQFFGTRSTWRDVADAARTTINKEAGNGEPSSSWKKRMLLAEHSPIRQLVFRWKWVGLKSWVSVHLVRHKFGIDHFVSTQRSDRTGNDRNAARQDTPVSHECIANAQAIMTISRKRLCMQASPETREAWKLLVDAIAQENPELASCCVPECVYRGFCPEFKCCGFAKSPAFERARQAYMDGAKEN